MKYYHTITRTIEYDISVHIKKYDEGEYFIYINRDGIEGFKKENEIVSGKVDHEGNILLEGCENQLEYNAVYDIFNNYLKNLNLIDMKNNSVKNIYDKAYSIFNRHTNNGGDLNYPIKELNSLADELEMVEVGYFNDDSVDGDNAESLRESGFKMNSIEVIDVLKNRIDIIKNNLD